MDKRTTLNTFILLVGISLLLVVINKNTNVRFLKNVFAKILYPISSTVNYPSTKTKSIYSRSAMILSAFDENLKLKQEISDMKNYYLDIDALKNELESLNKMMGYENNSFGRLIPVKVLLQSPDNYFLEFKINKGANHGIRKDMPVVAIKDSKWVLIGRIGEVLKDFSKVILVTSYDFRCGVDVNGAFRGVAKGESTWNLVVDYLSPDAKIKQGDEVYTSGTGGILPGGLYIGKITNVKSLEFSTGKQAYVKCAYYPQNAKYIYIVSDMTGKR
jgi:rod shape-determining protein MreC